MEEGTECFLEKGDPGKAKQKTFQRKWLQTCSLKDKYISFLLRNVLSCSIQGLA